MVLAGTAQSLYKGVQVNWFRRNWNIVLLGTMLAGWMIYTRWFASAEVLRYVRALVGE